MTETLTLEEVEQVESYAEDLDEKELKQLETELQTCVDKWVRISKSDQRPSSYDLWDFAVELEQILKKHNIKITAHE